MSSHAHDATTTHETSIPTTIAMPNTASSAWREPPSRRPSPSATRHASDEKRAVSGPAPEPAASTVHNTSMLATVSTRRPRTTSAAATPV
jgi:hypothetical protein